MNSCTSCGSEIPDEQRSCSMCYGDIAHGKDGYYEEWTRRLEEEDRKHKLDWENE